MALNKAVLAASVCSGALAVQPHGHFMALAQVKAVCSDHLYKGPSADDYRKMCSDLDADCAARNAELRRKYEALLAELKAECERQTRILEGTEDTHAAEQADVKVEAKDVAQAKKDVGELAHCRPELVDAEQDLAQEEATPNDSEADIDRECKAKKLVLVKRACVEKLKKAEAILENERSEHKVEDREEDQAAAAVPPQAEKKRIACQAYEDLKAKGPPTADCNNQDKKDALLRQADEYIEDLLAEYLRQKGILEGKEDDHAQEKRDVAPEAKDVKEAQVAVDRDAHCPPELEKAKAELSTQEGIPNDTEEDIDAECEATKAVMEAQACVDRLRAAEAVLARQKEQHSEESSEEQEAAAKLPPQEKIVCELKAALDAAKAARKALPCGSEQQSEPEPEPEKPKSGATRAASMVAVFAALLCAAVQA